MVDFAGVARDDRDAHRDDGAVGVFGAGDGAVVAGFAVADGVARAGIGMANVKLPPLGLSRELPLRMAGVCLGGLQPLDKMFAAIIGALERLLRLANDRLSVRVRF
jgi:hypothetical protein